MKSALVLLALVALTQAGVPMSRGLDGRIVHGQDAKVGEIPYQVSLQYRKDSRHFCGGSVLNKNYVITAAHCLKRKITSTIKIIAGSVDLKDPQSTHLPVKIIIHKQYNPSQSDKNDIALVKVDVPFEVSSTLNYVPLPKNNESVPVNSVAIVSGWGRLRQAGETPTKLQRTEILIVSQEYCSKAYIGTGRTIHSTHICAHKPNVETGACNGDSGGPLTVNGKLVGLVSWSLGCALPMYPTVYTRVPEYIDWINANAV